jgi:hypothetical protein
MESINMERKKVFIVTAKCTPIGKFMGTLANYTPALPGV